MPAIKLSEFFARFAFPERKSRRCIRSRVRRAAWGQVRRRRGRRSAASLEGSPPEVARSEVDLSGIDPSEVDLSEDPPPPRSVDLVEEMGLRAEKASGAHYLTYRVEAHCRLRSWLAGELGAEGLLGRRGGQAAAQEATPEGLLRQVLLERPLPKGFDASI